MITVWISIFIAAFESVIKQVCENNLTESERITTFEKAPFLNEKIFFTRYHNQGAFLNLGSKHPEFVKGLSVALCSICFVMYVFTLGKKGKILLKTGLAFLMGGAFSNTYDRLTKGYVVDYFGFDSKNEKIRNMVFNISDFCIMLGAAITVFRI